MMFNVFLKVFSLGYKKRWSWHIRYPQVVTFCFLYSSLSLSRGGPRYVSWPQTFRALGKRGTKKGSKAPLSPVRGCSAYTNMADSILCILVACFCWWQPGANSNHPRRYCRIAKYMNLHQMCASRSKGENTLYIIDRVSFILYCYNIT